MELKEGMKAPDFSLKDKDSKVHSLKDSKAHYTIVYFYPKDDTPGCTIEAINFTKELAEFQKLNTAVIGISGGNEASKKTFCIKHNIKISINYYMPTYGALVPNPQLFFFRKRKVDKRKIPPTKQ